MENTIQPQTDSMREKRRRRLVNILTLLVGGAVLYTIYVVGNGVSFKDVFLDIVGTIGLAAMTAAALYGIQSD